MPDPIEFPSSGKALRATDTDFDQSQRALMQARVRRQRLLSQLDLYGPTDPRRLPLLSELAEIRVIICENGG